MLGFQTLINSFKHLLPVLKNVLRACNRTTHGPMVWVRMDGGTYLQTLSNSGNTEFRFGERSGLQQDDRKF